MQIHQLKTRLVNTIIIEYADRLLIVDVAIRCHKEVLHYVEATLGRPVEDISLIICSHDDPDHMGGIKALAKATKADLAVPIASGSAFKKFYNDPSGKIVRLATSMAEATRARSWKVYLNPARRPAVDTNIAKAHKQPKDIINPNPPQKRIRHSLKHEQLIPGFEDWQVLHTPGHSWDSCCFFHRETGSLISGDTLLGSGKKGRLVKPAIYANPTHLKKSLMYLKRLNVKVVYPGHGSTMRGNNLLDHFS